MRYLVAVSLCLYSSVALSSGPSRFKPDHCDDPNVVASVKQVVTDRLTAGNLKFLDMYDVRDGTNQKSKACSAEIVTNTGLAHISFYGRNLGDRQYVEVVFVGLKDQR